MYTPQFPCFSHSWVDKMLVYLRGGSRSLLNRSEMKAEARKSIFWCTQDFSARSAPPESRDIPYFARDFIGLHLIGERIASLVWRPKAASYPPFSSSTGSTSMVGLEWLVEIFYSVLFWELDVIILNEIWWNSRFPRRHTSPKFESSQSGFFLLKKNRPGVYKLS